MANEDQSTAKQAELSPEQQKYIHLCAVLGEQQYFLQQAQARIAKLCAEIDKLKETHPEKTG